MLIGVSMRDYADDLAPGDRALSSPLVGYLNGVRLGFGLPRLEDGGMKTGVYFSGSGGNLDIYVVDSSGTATKRMSIRADGSLWLPDLGGDAATPDAGFVAIYGKSDDLYQRDDGGVVSPLA